MSMMMLAVADPDISTFALGWGKWFIRLSFLGATIALVAPFVVAAIEAIKKKKSGERAFSAITDASTFLEALKGVLEALSKLPAWIAIYLAGYALLWLAMKP